MTEPTSSKFTLYDPSKSLSLIYKKRVAEKLGETPDKVSARLESFRQCLDCMPHLKCPTDETFLLAFLHHEKYNLAKAQGRLDNFCTFRTNSVEGYSHIFDDSKRQREMWNKLLDVKFWVPLGFTLEGASVIMAKFVNLDLHKVTFGDALQGVQIFYDAILFDPRFQMGGIYYLFDLSNVSAECVAKIFDPKMDETFTKYYQDCYPLPLKKLIWFNVPEAFESLCEVYFEWLSEECKSKILLVGNDITEALDAVPGLKDLLPCEYGGDNKHSYDEMCEMMENKLRSLPDACVPLEVAVDESKRPKECQRTFRTYKDISADLVSRSAACMKSSQH